MCRYKAPPRQRDGAFFGTDIRTRHTDNFSRTFKKLLDAAKAVDTEDMLTDALLNGSAEGLFYRMILHARGEENLKMVFGIPGQAPSEQPALTRSKA